MRVRHAAVLVIMGCSGGTPAGSDGPADTDAAPSDTDVLPDDTDVVSDTDDPTGPTDTGETTWDVPPWEVLEVDCSAALPLPLAYNKVTWPPAAEDFSFDAHGYEITVSAGGLSRTPYGGPTELMVPNVSDVRGTRILPDGRIAMAVIAQGAILLVDPTTGAETVAASGLTNPNGIAIGVDGWIYVAVTGQILRIEPDVGTVEVVADMPNHSFDGISFSPDFTRLYFNEEFGRIHFVDFDANGVPGNPVQGPAIPVGAFSILDGMAVDACGNLYVTEMGGKVWRVTPTGDVDLAFNANELLSVVPALNFGTGIGGWDSNTLYVMLFTGGLFEVEVGVPGKWEPHLPVPTP